MRVFPVISRNLRMLVIKARGEPPGSLSFPALLAGAHAAAQPGGGAGTLPGSQLCPARGCICLLSESQRSSALALPGPFLGVPAWGLTGRARPSSIPFSEVFKQGPMPVLGVLGPGPCCVRGVAPFPVRRQAGAGSLWFAKSWLLRGASWGGSRPRDAEDLGTEGCLAGWLAPQQSWAGWGLADLFWEGLAVSAAHALLSLKLKCTKPTCSLWEAQKRAWA